jgi:hypothetical protein
MALASSCQPVGRGRRWRGGPATGYRYNGPNCSKLWAYHCMAGQISSASAAGGSSVADRPCLDGTDGTSGHSPLRRASSALPARSAHRPIRGTPAPQRATRSPRTGDPMRALWRHGHVSEPCRTKEPPPMSSGAGVCPSPSRTTLGWAGGHRSARARRSGRAAVRERCSSRNVRCSGRTRCPGPSWDPSSTRLI